MLLVYPDYTDRDVKGKVSGGNYSEGLASISAVLKQGGHDVGLFHLLYLHNEEDFKQQLKAKGEYDIIGFSIRTTAFPDAKQYIRWTREVYPDVVIDDFYSDSRSDAPLARMESRKSNFSWVATPSGS